jgi:SOS-response transcriptional repressor LexA
MILMLERSGFIERTPGTPRSIRILVDPDTLPTLRAAQAQTVKSPVQSH